MNKPQLYEAYKEVSERNKVLQLFNNVLEAENEQLKQEHSKFNEIWETEGITEQQIIDMRRGISDKCEEIKKLKKEIEELKEENENSIEIQAFEGYKIEYEKLEKEIKKLKEEIEELNKKKSIKWSREYAMPLITQLKEENEKLKEKLRMEKLHTNKLIHDDGSLRDKIHKLEEEIKKLKEDLKRENNKVCNLVAKIHQIS